MKHNSTLKIVIVDDDSTDRELLTEALHATETPCDVVQFQNGRELLDYLNASTSAPDLILLDLNMPIMNGKETLAELRKSERLMVIPVFILSTSSSRMDVHDAYTQGANLFLVKPASFDGLVRMARNLLELLGRNLVRLEVF